MDGVHLVCMLDMDGLHLVTMQAARAIAFSRYLAS